MAYKGLRQFMAELQRRNDLKVIDVFVDPVLEIAEIADRFIKSDKEALCFTNNGSRFPLLINMFGSDERMSLALGRDNLGDAGQDLEEIFEKMGKPAGGFLSRLRMLPGLSKLASVMPSKSKRRGQCQAVIIRDPDLGILPVLKCWPHDGGRFITLPVVHTKHPLSGEVNAGMYRMQILNKNTTGMHWHRHKTGAEHFEAYRKAGKKMPVSVVLGGDPVYTYAATAPLPGGMDEYILAGFLRKKKVRLVKCITNELYVPEDADIVIEGYVDPREDPVWEGPFGDHTGFYSLADWYPAFHVTCITHRKDAVYPATIVGVPPMEDSWIGKATEKLFLPPIKLTLQPEIVDLHMPTAGVAHNLVIVKIRKTYPGQGMKVINSLFGAGQMMFSKFIVVVSSDIDIRDYRLLISEVFLNTDLTRDILISRGPLDVLDHSSDNFSYGGKLGIDASIKMKEEGIREAMELPGIDQVRSLLDPLMDVLKADMTFVKTGMPLVILRLSKETCRFDDILSLDFTDMGLVFIVCDSETDPENLYLTTWQILSSTDPYRDLKMINGNIIVDSTSKSHRSDNFSREWPNVVASDDKTIMKIDGVLKSIGCEDLTESPSLKVRPMIKPGAAAVRVKT